jgi:hypothetical protein
LSKFSLAAGDLTRLLEHVPHRIRLDVIQFALDLTGIFDQSGVADAASGFISLLRGDLLGAAISAASIFPLGDVLKATRFGRYARSLGELISIAMRHPKLAFALLKPMRQIRAMLHAITGFVGAGTGHAAELIAHLGTITAHVERYFATMLAIERRGVKAVAHSKGVAHTVTSTGMKGQFIDRTLRHSEVTVRHVVDVLAGASTSGSRAIREGAEEMLGRMALAERWVIEAGVHGSVTDATRHITVRLTSFGEAFHLRLSKEGHLFDITHGVAGVSTIR